MPYTLFDQAFFGWLACSEPEMRLLLATFELLGHNPIGAAHASGFDHKGRQLYFHDMGVFRIHYCVARDGAVPIIDLRHRPTLHK